jgi:indolepyruvate ferredoxin oxidoreductase, beta subunit
MDPLNITNVRMAGIGGQGIIRASDILAQVAFQSGWQVKKSELHGMSQRGGSVSSDVRFGKTVFSPMIPLNETDFLLVSAADQIENNRYCLRPTGVLIALHHIPEASLPHRRSVNIALLGVLSLYLSFNVELWHAVIQDHFKSELHEANQKAFILGRQTGKIG